MSNQEAMSREVAKLIAGELEPVREELERLRQQMAAMREMFAPW
jgi:tryptophanyl-tRNA synthetase